jgi:hypothetical protein
MRPLQLPRREESIRDPVTTLAIQLTVAELEAMIDRILERRSTAVVTPAPPPLPVKHHFLTQHQAAELLQLNPGTLSIWRTKRVGPPFVRLRGRSVRYDQQALLQWASNPEASTHL